ncbi:MAG: ATP-dependent RecD-like DNA helicase [Nitrospinota bacterium]|nr:ATP-dependent RecD-like DNA helicase [Nitrospinota bacterium]
MSQKIKYKHSCPNFYFLKGLELKNFHKKKTSIRDKNTQNKLFENEDNILTGIVQRIRFQSDDSGFAVLIVQLDNDTRDPITVVGSLNSIKVGERVRFQGYWKDHPRFGKQLQANSYTEIKPTTSEEIEKYLSSGIIKNIGPALAKRIIKVFGEKTLDVMEKNPKQLLKIPGIGEKKLEEIKDSWETQSEMKEVMIFLRKYDVPINLSGRIFQTYGPDTIRILKENPYRLVSDIFGVGFQTADKIALSMGTKFDDPSRCAAGAMFVLKENSEREGHVLLPQRELESKASSLLGVEIFQISNVIQELEKRELIFTEKQISLDKNKDNPSIYLHPLHVAEDEVAKRVRILFENRKDTIRINLAIQKRGLSGNSTDQKLLNYAKQALEKGLANKEQSIAIEKSLLDKVLVITGGPGTGKTTVIKAVTNLYTELGLEILLGAPTGRASKRLSEVANHKATTIHRMLEYDWGSGGFLKDSSNPLTADCVIIDESSMLDIYLTSSLLKAIPDNCTLIMVGDVDQLPSVGPGNVLSDIIKSGSLTVVRLTQIYRQNEKSLLVQNAHRINEGNPPIEGITDFKNNAMPNYLFIEESDPENCANKIMELCKNRIPIQYNLNPIHEIQVISPMQRGTLGVKNLNILLQDVLNPSTGSESFNIGERSFRIGDKLIQGRNNYEKNVFNGDIGVIQSCDISNTNIKIAYDSNLIEYSFNELDELTHAFAITVHKSQGSEYPAVIIPLHTQHYPMLQRNLVYTALTRAKKLVVFVGTKKAMSIAVRNGDVKQRYSLLSKRLKINTDRKLASKNDFSDGNELTYHPLES